MGRNIHQMLPSVLNMGTRAGALACKFLLTLYLARYFQLDDIGVYGLVVGAVALMPAFVGWGYNYFMNREIVGKPPLEAGRRMRDRLLLSLASSSLGLLVWGGLMASGLLQVPGHLALIGWIILMECLAFDLHLPLVSCRKALLANSLLFVRSAAWMIPVMLAGLYDPAYRTLDILLGAWALGATLNLPMALVALRAWPLKEIAASPVDIPWMKSRLCKSGLVYVSDIGLVGMLYLDRYLLNHFVNLETVGVFTLFWSIANAMYAMVQSGVLQLAMPRLTHFYNQGDLKAYWQTMRSTYIKMLATVIILSGLILAATPYALPLLGRGELMQHIGLFALLLLGMGLKATADLANNVLYSRRMDKKVPIIILAGFAFSLLCNLLLLPVLGIMATGVSLCLASLVLISIRGHILLAEWRRDAVSPRMKQEKAQD